MAFDEDMTTLISTTADATTQTWRLRLPADPFAAMCALAGRSLTAQEYSQYVPAGEAFAKTCP
ncbi:hypothetical protein [Microbispora sp. CA-102843]|uniref:hypothetical protein n=1 Tax=Microbispora sp. CA-102843 TaxID=3239952 RepID=UPI003D918D7B